MVASMKTISLDLRERILAAYDAQEGTREEVAKRFRVSVGMVKKLLQQRSRTGDIAHRHRFSGRKAKILPEYRERLGTLIAAQPDLTLSEIKARLAMSCSVPALHYALVAMGLTFKKRRCMPPSKVAPMSPRPERNGSKNREASPRPGWSSSTSRPPRRT